MAHAADGDPYFVENWTPGTFDAKRGVARGDDLCGSMTMAAMDAVVDVAMAMLDDFDSVYGLDSVYGIGRDRRLLVSSSSNGLSAASKWIASTSWEVHALVDWEGPPNSLAQSVATYAFSPIDRGSVYWDPNWDAAAAKNQHLSPPANAYLGLDTLTFDCWQTWFADHEKGGAAYNFFFRPPVEVLDELFDEEQIEVDEDAPDTVDCGMYVNWYYPLVYNGRSLFWELSYFWLQRSAANFLPLLADLPCAYVRIQFAEDHAQPPWWFNRHANIALNAAWDSGANPHVYYADSSYVVGRDSPTQLTGSLQETIDSDSFDPEDHALWPDWPTEKYRQILYQLDLLRWAYHTTFQWSFDRSWDAYTGPRPD